MATILHIEDDMANKVLVERILEREGHIVLHAADGESGVQVALENAPDLLLIDMGLPDMDGQTVVTLLQQIPHISTKPMVAITAWPAEKAREIARRYGLSGCITKPIDIRKFPQQIAHYIRPIK